MNPNRKHGSPYDRGSADAYYGRGTRPHKYEGTARITLEPETEDWTEYLTGYRETEEAGDRKDYGSDEPETF